MSEPIAETYVEIRPKLAGNFSGDLQSQVQRDVEAASRAASVTQGSAFAKLSPSAQSLAQRSGITKELDKIRAADAALVAANAAVATGEAQLTQQNERLARSHENVAIHAHRSQIAGFTIRGTTLGMGAAAVVAAEGLRKLSQALKTTGDEAQTTEGRLRNAAAAALSGDFATAAQRLGEQAAFSFQPGAKAAAEAERTAKMRETSLQNAIALAAQYVKVRDEAAKATGQQGTAEGVVKFQLEQQLRILRAQVAALPKGLNRVAFAQLGLGPSGTRNENVVGRTGTGRPTDLDFQLRAARAAATNTAKDDLALYTQRRDFLRGLISRTEAAGTDTVAAKTNLKRLYSLLDDADSQVVTLQKQSLERRRERLQESIALQQTQVQIQEANARTGGQEIAALQSSAALARRLSEDKRLDAQDRAGYALQAAQDDKQIFEINRSAAEEAKRLREQEARDAKQRREEAERRLKEARDRARQTRELVLENAVSLAGLTKRTSDDRKAIKAQIAYYRGLVASSKGLEKEQARAQLISARASLQGLKKDTGGGATVAEFFAQAARQFQEFGSNIGGKGSVLSGQDARGRFAGLALQRSKLTASGEIAGAIGRYAAPQLTESQKQTQLLRRIERGIREFGVPAAISDREAISRARSKAANLGGV